MESINCKESKNDIALESFLGKMKKVKKSFQEKAKSQLSLGNPLLQMRQKTKGKNFLKKFVCKANLIVRFAVYLMVGFFS